jgi:glycosyltransferase involved in cell wall biosynthesis
MRERKIQSGERMNTAVHFIPGDGPNALIQAISSTSNLKIKILTLYESDRTVPNFCAINGVELDSLGFIKKDLKGQILQFLKYLYREQPKIVFAHSFYPSFICSIGRLLFWRTIFVPVRHHNKVHIISRNQKAISVDRWISKVTQHTVAVSDAVKETLIQQGCKASKISVIYNGLSKQSSNYITHIANDVNRSFNLIALGRIDWQKNYEGMLNIVSILRDGGTDLTLTVLGSGDEKYLAQLVKIQERLNLSGSVRWLGRQPDIYKYLNESDLFVHTALDEACPLVLIETLMYGIPVVSSNLGGCRDILNGFYKGSDPRNTFEFAEKIKSVLENLTKSKEIAQKNTFLAINKFSPENMQYKYTELSLRLIS